MSQLSVENQHRHRGGGGDRVLDEKKESSSSFGVEQEEEKVSFRSSSGGSREEAPMFLQAQTTINLLKHPYPLQQAIYMKQQLTDAATPRSVKVEHPLASSLSESEKEEEEKIASSGTDYSREERIRPWGDSLLESDNKPLVRRTKEEGLLLRSYYCMQKSAPQSMVLITGPSGSGKTQLAKSLRSVVTQQGGFFISGKFEQMQQRREPYRAFVAAFTEFTNAVMERGEAATKQMQCAIHTAVGDEAAVLTSMIPSLEKILGHKKYCCMSKAKADDAIQRFVFVFRMFLRAVCSPERPVVLLVDDLQWADPCSLDVLKSIVTDVDNHGLVVVGTCESNVSPDSYLAERLREVEANSDTEIVNIQVDNLGQKEVASLLARELDADMEKAESLADIVSQQTSGNLFYIVQILKWMQESELLFVDEKNEWNWDVEEIRVSLSPNPVATFLSDKLQQQLAPDTREVLKVAACLGSHLDEELLEYTMGHPVARNLSEALSKGVLVVDEPRGGYAFAHDSVQHAAYGLIPEAERELFHVEVGRRLWRKLDKDELDRYLFVVLSQFIVGKRLIKREKEIVAIATLCLHAGKKASRSSTFRTAAVYLNLGIELVGERGWRDEYDLTLALHNAGAEMEMCSAHFEHMNELIEVVLSRARTPLDKVQANSTKIYELGASDRQQEAIDLGVEVLKDLDERFPSRLCKAHVLKEFNAVRMLLKGKSDEQLMRLPPLEDPRKLACLQVLNTLFLNCLFIRPKLAPFVSMKLLKITLLHGLSPFASIAFSTYGMTCLGACDVDCAIRYGQLGLKLLDSYGALEFLPRVHAAYYGVIHSWRYPIQDALEPLLRGHRIGMQTGDHEFSFLCSNCYCFLSLDSGVPLDLIMRRWSTFEESMRSSGQKTTRRMSLPFVQAMTFYMDPSENPLSFRGRVLDLIEEERISLESGRTNHALTIRLCRTSIAYTFNDFEKASETSDCICKYSSLVPTIELAVYTFLHGMVAIEMARRGKDPRKNRRKVQKTIKNLKTWSRMTPHNILEKLFMLEGELASYNGKADKAYEKFTCAIALAKDAGFLYTHALANERLGRHLLALGLKSRAEPFFRNACDIYGEWGGKAKVLQLETELNEIYPQS